MPSSPHQVFPSGLVMGNARNQAVSQGGIGGGHASDRVREHQMHAALTMPGAVHAAVVGDRALLQFSLTFSL